MDNERRMIIAALDSKEASLFFYQKAIRVAKHENMSTEALKEGNHLFQSSSHNAKTHSEMWSAYSCSISYAPSETKELALGYAGRSSFLLHVGKYEDSLLDIERALKITTCISLKIELLLRKAECLTALGHSDKNNSLEKAKFWLKKIDKKEKNRLTSLINKTQRIVENGKTDVKNIEDNKIEILDIVSSKKAESTSKTLAVRHDEKNGRHLVAARNIEPGEIICIQKPYVMTSNTEFTPFAYCCHCLKVSWASIPCAVCGWAFFCSEKCRDEAWEQYHDIECFVMPRIRHNVQCELWRQLTIRTVILAIREAGGIAELRAELAAVDQCTDEKAKGFSKNGEFEGDKFISLYSLSHRLSPNLSKAHIQDAVKILIAFIKYSTLFGEQNKFKVITELQNDHDVIFVGSLILRLFGIFNLNYQEILEDNVRCESGHDPKLCWNVRCCYRGTTVSPLLSLINHNCNPNTAMMFTDAAHMIVYALKPLKKNDQIFHSYSGCGTFYQKSKSHRQWMTKNAYNFTCKCKSCQEDWPLLDKISQLKEKLPNINKSDKITAEMMKELVDLISALKQKNSRFDEQTLKELENALRTATQNYTEPSHIICSLMDALMKVYDKLYLTRVHMTTRCRI